MCIILTVVMVAWKYTDVKTHQIIYFKCLQCIVGQLYLNTAVKKLTVVALIISRRLRVRGMGWVSLGQMGPAQKQGSGGGRGKPEKPEAPPDLGRPG